MENSLIISDYSIRQDVEGRYCLNDLHKAAGNKPKHQPANWLRLEQTKALITVIERSSDLRNAINIMQGGRSQGTFVVNKWFMRIRCGLVQSFSYTLLTLMMPLSQIKPLIF